MPNDFLIAKEDNLFTPPVRAWSETKYKVIFDYNSMFSTGMKNHWDQRIYIDLYCAAGKSKIENSNKILYSSALLAMKVKDPFTQYIFCDESEDCINALKTRVEREFMGMNTSIIVGDCNLKIDEIINLIPTATTDNKVLSFCFIDPFAFNIDFETIRKLSNRFVDFLILFAFDMDVKRNFQLYLRKDNNRIDKFLGIKEWREKWIKAEKKGTNLIEFLAIEFTQQMVKLGYLEDAINNFIHFRSDEKNLPLYYLAFYSRHKTGYKFWKTVKNINTSPTLFD